MIFYYFRNIESTQVFLFNLIKDSINNNLDSQKQMPILVVAKEQTSGIGSRANKWNSVKCGLYFSFSLHKNLLPTDVLPQSLSIYFGVIFLRFFHTLNPHIWLKWPNDFYLDSSESKVGGIITQVYNEFIIFGIGLNLVDNKYKAILDSMESITYQDVIIKLLEFLGFKDMNFDINKNIKIVEHNNKCDIFLQNNWQNIFEYYKNEYYKNHNFTIHFDNKIISLKDSILQNDGSIKINDRILYSLR